MLKFVLVGFLSGIVCLNATMKDEIDNTNDLQKTNNSYLNAQNQTINNSNNLNALLLEKYKNLVFLNIKIVEIDKRKK